ncbi:NAD(P)/FAD-dependent oxidoreductase [Halobacteriovorax sp. ZH4_bin.1]|uniref:NAD(P)/FAD-dependent oxidoreductase n=1 Tax=unclassified Halobacteriovorax TaxID=2639665 RepID=UPI00371D502B
MKKIKVVIIGAGFAGIALAKGLANKDSFEVVILDKKNHHLFHPLLYQVASASLSPGDISMPIREILSHAKNIKVHMQEVVSIDKDINVVKCKSGDKYQYDYLAVATGSRPFYFGNDNWKKNAPGLKTLTDALNIRDRVLDSFEKEEIKLNEKEKKLNIVIIGGGPTGVELAGAFAEVAYKTLVNEYHDFDPKLTKIYLIEGGQQILSSYTHPTSEKARKYLEDLGVKVLTDEVVEDIGDDYVQTKNQRIESKNIIWAAGNRATKLISKLGVKQDRMGRAVVEKDLSLKDYPNIYILGDAASFKSQDGSPLPSLAPVAAQQGKHLAQQLLKDRRFVFKYLDKGSMATVGKYKAVLEWKGIKLTGPIAWLAWSLVHIFFLINFRNKVMVFMQWAWSLISNKRRIRIIK